ncbi:MAG: glycogen synthase GlgA [Nitrospiraceae bacterium]|nr:glycogen synthase GlgA [Nitrospiraceae bacterium]
MKILIAASEAVPFAKTGGLADVTSALHKKFGKLGKKSYLVLPLYKKIRKEFKLKDTKVSITVPLGNRIIKACVFTLDDSVYFIDCPEFFDRDELYGTSQNDYPDNASRFIFFSRAILESCKALNLKPDIIHCNEWQTGLVPLYLKTLYRNDVFFSKTASIITIHNLGYQGLFSAFLMNLTGLSPALFTPEGIEFYGKMNFLKAGLISADLITTVSNTYAGEISTKEYGFGLDGLLRKRKSDIRGIINGIDYDEWNTEKDKYISKKYSVNDLSGKKQCKLQLIKECSINPDPKIPIIAIISRLSAQKGIDLFLPIIESIISEKANIVILGKGDDIFHKKLTAASKKYKDMLNLTIGFNDEFAHRIYSGADIFLMPSRYEPCGLGQIIAMRYGTIPVVRKTGGLADTVSEFNTGNDKGTGFLFSEYTPNALYTVLKNALDTYKNENKWQKLILNAMRTDFSWENSARKYIEIYNEAIRLKK